MDTFTSYLSTVYFILSCSMDLVLSFIWKRSDIKDRIENKLAFSSLRFVLKLVHTLSWKYSIPLTGNIILRSVLEVNHSKSLTLLVSLKYMVSKTEYGSSVYLWVWTPEYLVCCLTEVRNTPSSNVPGLMTVIIHLRKSEQNEWPNQFCEAED